MIKNYNRSGKMNKLKVLLRRKAGKRKKLQNKLNKTKLCQQINRSRKTQNKLIDYILISNNVMKFKLINFMLSFKLLFIQSLFPFFTTSYTVITSSALCKTQCLNQLKIFCPTADKTMGYCCDLGEKCPNGFTFCSNNM